MMQDAAVAHPLGSAGDLASLHQNIIPAGSLRIEAEALQGLHHRRGEPLHRQLLKLSGIGDEGVIQVAQIVIHSAAAGRTANYVDVVFLYKSAVDLRFRILILAHHNGVVILPQQEVFALQPMGQYKFLKSQIVIGVLGTCFQIKNLLCLFHYGFLSHFLTGQALPLSNFHCPSAQAFPFVQTNANFFRISQGSPFV